MVWQINRSGVSFFPNQFKMTKVPFSLTYIQYDKEDGIVGWVMALVSLTPVYYELCLAWLLFSFFVCILCSSILLHRDMHSVFFLIQMVTETLLFWRIDFVHHIQPNTKASYKTATPTKYVLILASNLQLEGFSRRMECLPIIPNSCRASVSILLCGCATSGCYSPINNLSRVVLSSQVQKVLALLILWIVWALVVSSRTYLGEHTLSQTLVGILVGFSFGLCWYFLDEKAFLFDWAWRYSFSVPGTQKSPKLLFFDGSILRYSSPCRSWGVGL